MMPAITAKMNPGLFNRSIRAVSKAIQRAQVRALRETAQVAFRAAKAAIQFKNRTGDARRSLTYVPPRMTVNGMVSSITTGESKVLAFHDNGTGLYGPHGSRYYIFPRTAMALRFIGAGGRTVMTPYVVHPGVKAQHFMRAGEVAGEAVLLEKMTAYVNKAIEGSD